MLCLDRRIVQINLLNYRADRPTQFKGNREVLRSSTFKVRRKDSLSSVKQNLMEDNSLCAGKENIGIPT